MRNTLWALGAVALPFLGLSQEIGTVLILDDIVDEFDHPLFDIDGPEWLGLVIDGDSSRVEPIEVEWLGTDPDRPAFNLGTQPARPVLLWTGVPQARAGSARTLLRYTTVLPYDAGVVTLQLGQTQYELALVGDGPAVCDGGVTLSDGGNLQQLYSLGDDQFACDEPHLSVHWAGDIDGDDRLDLVTTFSRKYSYHPRRMYLSSAARPGDLVGLVALFER